MWISFLSADLYALTMLDKRPNLNILPILAGYNSTLALLRLTVKFPFPFQPCFCPIASCYRTATATRLQYVTKVIQVNIKNKNYLLIHSFFVCSNQVYPALSTMTGCWTWLATLIRQSTICTLIPPQ